jgi:hypothetical protein
VTRYIATAEDFTVETLRELRSGPFKPDSIEVSNYFDSDGLNLSQDERDDWVGDDAEEIYLYRCDTWYTKGWCAIVIKRPNGYDWFFDGMSTLAPDLETAEEWVYENFV